MIGRRRALALAGASVLAVPALVRPASATPREVAEQIAKLTGGKVPQPGRVKLDLAQMVENGNAVGLAVSADAPEGGRVESLHVFAEGNPNPEVVHAVFGPASFAPKLSTRIRLATSQTVVALAVMDDGSCWTDSVTVLVTLAACLE
jgi:sulfur-oxidizing protein SoxY